MRYPYQTPLITLVLTLGLLTACDSPIGDPAESNTAEAPQPPEQTVSNQPYRLNLEGVTIPTEPATGEVGGKDFIVEKAVYNISSSSLRLVGTHGQEVILFVLLDDPAKPEGQSIDIETPEYSIGDANISVTYIQNQQPVSKMLDTGFVLKLAFDDQRVLPTPPAESAEDQNTGPDTGDTADGQTEGESQTPPETTAAPAQDDQDPQELLLPGRVYVCLPDPTQSYVIGEFQAQVRP